MMLCALSIVQHLFNCVSSEHAKDTTAKLNIHSPLKLAPKLRESERYLSGQCHTSQVGCSKFPCHKQRSAIW